MAGRDQQGKGDEPDGTPGYGYTANPYDSPQAPGYAAGPGAGQVPNPTTQMPNPTTQMPNPTAHYTDQVPTDQFAAQPQAQWGAPPPYVQTQQYASAPQYDPTPQYVPTPPYGTPLPPQQQPPMQPPPPRQRGSIWPWVIAAVVIFVLVIGGGIFFFLQSISSDLDAAPRPTRTLAPVTSTAAPTTSFTPQFVAISGTVESNDGSTLVITPEDGGDPVTVITDSDTQVILGGEEGVAAFQPGDSVFVQGGEQEDGRVLARMIIGSLFGG